MKIKISFREFIKHVGFLFLILLGLKTFATNTAFAGATSSKKAEQELRGPSGSEAKCVTQNDYDLFKDFRPLIQNQEGTLSLEKFKKKKDISKVATMLKLFAGVMKGPKGEEVEESELQKDRNGITEIDLSKLSLPFLSKNKKKFYSELSELIKLLGDKQYFPNLEKIKLPLLDTAKLDLGEISSVDLMNEKGTKKVGIELRVPAKAKPDVVQSQQTVAAQSPDNSNQHAERTRSRSSAERTEAVLKAESLERDAMNRLRAMYQPQRLAEEAKEEYEAQKKNRQASDSVKQERKTLKIAQLAGKMAIKAEEEMSAASKALEKTKEAHSAAEKARDLLKDGRIVMVRKMMRETPVHLGLGGGPAALTLESSYAVYQKIGQSGVKDMVKELSSADSQYEQAKSKAEAASKIALEEALEARKALEVESNNLAKDVQDIEKYFENTTAELNYAKSPKKSPWDQKHGSKPELPLTAEKTGEIKKEAENYARQYAFKKIKLWEAAQKIAYIDQNKRYPGELHSLMASVLDRGITIRYPENADVNRMLNGKKDGTGRKIERGIPDEAEAFVHTIGQLIFELPSVGH